MNNNKIKIVFMGTPDFSVPALRLLHSKYTIEAVVTSADKPKGRGLQLLPSPVKIEAVKLNIPVLQPVSLKDPEFVSSISMIQPDIIVVIAFKILPKDIYTQAKIASFNVHGSLLPKYRGAAPINWAIINGDRRSGLTSFLLKEIVDTGDMLLKRELKLPENCTAGDLYEMLMPIAAEIAVSTCELIVSGEYKPLPQDDEIASPAPKLFKENCRINWNQNAEIVKNYIHGTSPFPGSWTEYDGQRVKLFRMVNTSKVIGKPGEFLIDSNHFYIQCSDHCLSVVELQMPGRKQMKCSDFISGFRGAKTGIFV
ncbi:MAG: methionyl-tRNA formyltransferase [Candidatus Kapabacteria bacterium]|nr:methionyl-tRNA formyltransferase [Candidatus Kapabacteria bacterium]